MKYSFRVFMVGKPRMRKINNLLITNTYNFVFGLLAKKIVRRITRQGVYEPVHHESFVELEMKTKITGVD